MAPTKPQKRRCHLCSTFIHTALLLPPASASPMSPPPLANPNPHGSTNPLFVDFRPAAPDVGHESAHVPSTRISDDSPSISTADSQGIFAHKREQLCVSDMDEYLVASRMCREEAMACALLTATVHWPFAEKENRKKKKHKYLVLTCRALNAGSKQSWRGLKKLFCKQFMPFSNRDNHGLHHINTTISKRSLKTFNIGGRKVDPRIQVGVTKCDFVLGCKELQGKENMAAERGNEMRDYSSVDIEIYPSRLTACEKNCKLQEGKLQKGGIKKTVRILLNKACSIVLDVCDILNLE